METNEYNLNNDGFNEMTKSNETDVSIPITHEQVVIGKTQIDTKKIRITKHINEEEQLLNIPLTHDEIDIKTIEKNEFVDAFPEAIRYEGDTMIISVLKEISVVRIVLEKEIHVTRKRVETQHSETITLKKEEITIENIALIN